MLAQLNTFALRGIDATPVRVEVDHAYASQPRTVIVGLPDAAVRESVHRIECALENLSYRKPTGRAIVNLAPADIRKSAVAFDLPIAVGLLAATQQMVLSQPERWALLGELALDGTVRAVRGVLSMALAARDAGVARLVVPAANAAEAAVVAGLEVYPVVSLSEVVGLLSGRLEREPVAHDPETLSSALNRYDVDFAEVRGQESAKRALVIAAAGGHNLLMIGPPGSGKTMLARRLPTILPPLTPDESLETTRVYSAVGRLDPGVPLLTARPFRSPHHTISDAGMVGGGSVPVPGEISMAHHGVLFLDELPEFGRRALEVLRQPLEEGRVTISRAAGSFAYPASLMLVASMNPCPCGYLGDPHPRHVCKCGGPAIERYMAKLSGPLLDRIDLHIEVGAVPFDDLSATGGGGPGSAAMRAQVEAARAAQRQRFGSTAVTNGRMSVRDLREHAAPDAEGRELLREAMDALGLSARAHDRILRMARTVADLAGAATVRAEHVAEAIGYRTLDRRLWAAS